MCFFTKRWAIFIKVFATLVARLAENYYFCKIMSEYNDYINNTLKPRISEKAIVLDLFAGCGGLSLGFEAAGYTTIGYECVPSAVETYNKNLNGVCHLEKLSVGFGYPNADIIIGGPPCQPFSKIGKQQGFNDARDGFPIFIDAVKRLQPKVFLFENVSNLLGRHKWYYDLILDELHKLGYLIETKVVNAVNYGVPQNRERVITVGHQSRFSFPLSSMKKTTVGEAIGDTMSHELPGSRFLTPAQDKYIAIYEKKSYCINPRDLYADRPARTLTCRNLAGATSDMQRVKLPDGRRRRIVQREAARLQSFPDWFEFCGNETQQFTQIGNAVPPLLAYKLAEEVKKTFALEPRPKKEIDEINFKMHDLFAAV